MRLLAWLQCVWGLKMSRIDIEQQRKAFEAWVYSNKWNIFRVRDMGLDHYVDDFVNGAWHGWLAVQQQEGCVMVPVEPTWEMVEAAEGNNGHIESIYRDMIQAAQE